MIYDIKVLLMIYILQNDNRSLVAFFTIVALNGMTDKVAFGMVTTNYYTLDLSSALTTTSKPDLPSTPVLNCGYGIFADNEIYVTTSTEPLAVISNILVKLTEQKRRRKRQGDCPYDLPPVVRLTIHSSTFYLDNTTVGRTELSSRLVLKTCVYAGYSEVLEIWLRDKSNVSKIYGYKNVTIQSQPTIPNFLPPGHNETVVISLCDLTGNLSVVSANNGGSCVSWNCSVRCINCSKLFWVENGITIMTSSKYVQIGQIFGLEISCNETASDLQGSIQESSQMLMVRFSRNCTINVFSSTLTSITTKYTTSVINQVSNQTVHTVSTHRTAMTELSRVINFNATAVLPISTLAGITLKTAGDILKTYKKIAASPTEKEQTTGYSTSPVWPDCSDNVDNGFLNDPMKLAAVATTGGIIIGIALVIGCIVVSRRFKLCLCIPAVVSPVAEEEQQRKDFRSDQTSHFDRTSTT